MAIDPRIANAMFSASLTVPQAGTATPALAVAAGGTDGPVMVAPGPRFDGTGLPGVFSRPGVIEAAFRISLADPPEQALVRLASGMTFPFANTRQYLRAMRLRWRLRHVVTYEQARAEVEKFVSDTQANYTIALDGVHRASTGEELGKTVLETGALGLGAGAAIGSLAGPIGTAIGAAVGLIVGVAIGLIPLHQIEFQGECRRHWDAMVPIEKFYMLGKYREAMDAARRTAGQPLWPAWRLGYSTGGFFEHTEFEGVDVTCLYTCQDLWERCNMPAPLAGTRDPYFWYLVAFCASVLNDDQKITDSELWHRANDSKSFGWFRALCESDATPLTIVAPAAAMVAKPYADDNYKPRGTTVRISDLRAGTVRAIVRNGTGGVPRMDDFATPPTTEQLKRLVLERNTALAKAQAGQ